LFAILISMIAGALFGLIPIFKYAGPRTANDLRQGGRGLSASRERHRARNTLVVVQVALALVLLISSGLMIRTVQALQHVQPGFTHPESIQTLRISIPRSQAADGPKTFQIQQEIQRKLAAIPGVTSVSFASSVTMDGNNSGDPIFAEDHPYVEGKMPPI